MASYAEWNINAADGNHWMPPKSLVGMCGRACMESRRLFPYRSQKMWLSHMRGRCKTENPGAQSSALRLIRPEGKKIEVVLSGHERPLQKNFEKEYEQ